MYLSNALSRTMMTWLTEWSPAVGRPRPERPRRGGASVRKVCRGCERQRALFRYHGIVKWDRYHTLCFRCFRAQVNRARPVRQRAAADATHALPD
jgi:hypothetical protein